MQSITIATASLALAGLCAAGARAQLPLDGRQFAAEVLPLCQVEVVEVLADELGPDIYTVPWLGGVGDPDGDGIPNANPNVSVGQCAGICISALVTGDLNCIPVSYRPVRIEAHTVNAEGEPEVVYLRVYVPDDCDCRDYDGPVIGSYFVNPWFDPSLSAFALAMHGPDGNGSNMLRGILATLPDLGVGTASGFTDALQVRLAHALGFQGASTQYVQANLGQLPMTSTLKAAMEAWLWGRFADALFATSDEFGLSSQAEAMLVLALQAQFPQLLG